MTASSMRTAFGVKAPSESANKYKHKTYEFIPHADQDISISKYEKKDVVLCYIMKIGIFFIGKEKVWFPQALEHLGVDSKCVTFKVSRKLQTRIIPPLTKKYVYTIIL